MVGVPAMLLVEVGKKHRLAIVQAQVVVEVDVVARQVQLVADLAEVKLQLRVATTKLVAPLPGHAHHGTLAPVDHLVGSAMKQALAVLKHAPEAG